MGETWEPLWPQDGPKLKKPRKSDFVDPPQRGQVGSQNWRKKRPGGMLCRLFDVVFGRPVFSSILGDFRLRNWCLFGVVDMAKV